MKNVLRAIISGIVCLNFAAFAQPGMAGGPRFGGAMDKLFGDNQSFSATLETQMTDATARHVADEIVAGLMARA